ncbi:NS2 protein [Tenuivirus oryzalbae]|uniref:NS2 protein n=1 Tax=Tenuivirus oryzalbae TaxID=3052764 RepID=A0A2H5CMR6_9VIRU|nr:NS2 protein [Tenuivirus oryzalbae]AUH25690.1 NS2 protein [Tenuivirus oryzalbae]
MAVLLYDNDYYQLLVETNRHYGSYQKLFAPDGTKEDHYMSVSDSSWILTFYKGELSSAMKSYCVCVGAHCLNVLSQTSNALDESKVKCWLCDKEAYMTTTHLKVVKLTNLINGFELATESYQVCMKTHSADDPSKYIGEICFPPHLKGYMKDKQKFNHKFMVVTNGFSTNNNFRPIRLTTETVEDSDQYVLVGNFKCPLT